MQCRVALRTICCLSLQLLWLCVRQQLAGLGTCNRSSGTTVMSPQIVGCSADVRRWYDCYDTWCGVPLLTW
jgi:hypothetical protein